MSSVSLSRLFPSKTNKIEGYDRLFHTRRYFKTKALEIPKFKMDSHNCSHAQIMKQLGYNNMEKFLRNVAEWNTLRHPIPFHYMDAIDIDYDILEMCLEVDREAYMGKLNQPRYPKYANIRSGIYEVTYLLPCVSESEAIAYVQEILATESKAPFYIEYRDFLTIETVSGEAPVYYYRIPGLIKEGYYYLFTEIRSDF